MQMEQPQIEAEETQTC